MSNRIPPPEELRLDRLHEISSSLSSPLNEPARLDEAADFIAPKWDALVTSELSEADLSSRRRDYASMLEEAIEWGNWESRAIDDCYKILAMLNRVAAEVGWDATPESLPCDASVIERVAAECEPWEVSVTLERPHALIGGSEQRIEGVQIHPHLGWLTHVEDNGVRWQRGEALEVKRAEVEDRRAAAQAKRDDLLARESSIRVALAIAARMLWEKRAYSILRKWDCSANGGAVSDELDPEQLQLREQLGHPSSRLAYIDDNLGILGVTWRERWESFCKIEEELDLKRTYRNHVSLKSSYNQWRKR